MVLNEAKSPKNADGDHASDRRIGYRGILPVARILGKVNHDQLRRINSDLSEKSGVDANFIDGLLGCDVAVASNCHGGLELARAPGPGNPANAIAG